jgi:Domain of unknown function (DUF4386)
MTDRSREFSPQTWARVAGVLYLINIVAGLLGEMFVRNAMIVSGDAAATAANIAHAPQLWRLGIAGDLIMQATDVPLMLILYLLLKPVNRNLALLAMLFTLVQTASLVANKLNLMMPLFVSGDAAYLQAFTPDQLHALGYLAIRAHAHGFAIGLIFFGFECLITGYLIFASGFLPRIIGIAIQFAGVCYLVNSFALLVAPALDNMLFPAILLPCFVAELSLCLWLLVKGVHVPKWTQRARAADA